MTPPRYLLCEHVFVCHSGGQTVLLDLRQDKYLALNGAQIDALGALVADWPRQDSPGAPAGPVPNASAIAEALMCRGLLTTDVAAGKDATPAAVERPKSALCGEDIDLALAIRGHHLAAFVIASATAAAALRWRPIEQIVRRVKFRKSLYVRLAERPDAVRTRELVMIFDRLRPFVFTAREACLFDSLALVEFLARYHIFPTWVFGVRTHPFAAHCWAQDGDTVFNDFPEHVAAYTPIMAV